MSDLVYVIGIGVGALLLGVSIFQRQDGHGPKKRKMKRIKALGQPVNVQEDAVERLRKNSLGGSGAFKWRNEYYE